jgi:hypothetical protein
MSLPVIQSIGTLDNDNDSQSVTNAAAGVVSGDLLILAVALLPATTITTPSGWTLIASVTDGGSALRGALYRRIATGAAADAPTVSFGAGVDYTTRIMRLDGQHATPEDTSASATQTSGTSPPMASITTAFTDELLIGFLVVDSLFSANPTNWTQQTTDDQSSMRSRLYSRDATTAGAYGGETATTLGSTPSVSIVVGIKSTTSAAGGGSDLMMGASCGV